MSVEVTKTLEVGITVYDCKCKECGEDVGFEADTDSDGDIRITVEPCEQCLKEIGADDE